MGVLVPAVQFSVLIQDHKIILIGGEMVEFTTVVDCLKHTHGGNRVLCHDIL